MFEKPFVGSAAVAAGRVTRSQLRGPRFRALFPGIFVRSGVPVDHPLLCRAGVLAVHGRGVLAGWSAAEMLGASCALPGAPVELIVSRSSTPTRAGLVVRADVLDARDVTTVDGLRVTTPARTAFDLARRPLVGEAIVAVDALRRRTRVTPEEILEVAGRCRGARGIRRLAGVLGRSTWLADSPMETRIRVAIEDAGLPQPVLQHPVGPYRLDLSYPWTLLAFEYDGREHLTAERARHDLDRQAYLTRRAWTVERLEAWEVFTPARTVLRVHEALVDKQESAVRAARKNDSQRPLAEVGRGTRRARPVGDGRGSSPVRGRGAAASRS